jgi:hypothetical protein
MFIRRKMLACVVSALFALPLAGKVFAEPDHVDIKRDKAPAHAKLTVAILDFESSGSGGDKIGKQIPDALAALLSDDDGFQLVERAQVAKAVAEQAVGLSGLVDSDKAIKIGKIVGAQILVTGKVFTLDRDTYITAKLIGSETSLVQAVMVKDASDKDIGALVAGLSEKISAKLRGDGSKLIASEGEKDPIIDLKEKLAHLKKPVVSVAVTERHESRHIGQPIDPAAETEIKKVLVECGFEVIDDQQHGPRPTVTLSGEGFSEFGALLGNLTSCSARLELKAVDVQSGAIQFTDSTTARAVDLSEAIASKTALQKAAHAMTIKMLRQWAKTLPHEEKK